MPIKKEKALWIAIITIVIAAFALGTVLGITIGTQIFVKSLEDRLFTVEYSMKDLNATASQYRAEVKGMTTQMINYRQELEDFKIELRNIVTNYSMH